jgi:hypothetical protein
VIECILGRQERQPMSLDELMATSTALPAGKCAGIHHDIYGELFPPGEPDEDARAVCHAFARSAGCRVENRPGEHTVWFVKDV